MEQFSNRAFLKWSNSQMEQFSNRAFLKWSNSQMEQFSNAAFWGRHPMPYFKIPRTEKYGMRCANNLQQISIIYNVSLFLNLFEDMAHWIFVAFVRQYRIWIALNIRRPLAWDKWTHQQGAAHKKPTGHSAIVLAHRFVILYLCLPLLYLFLLFVLSKYIFETNGLTSRALLTKSQRVIQRFTAL